MVQGEMTSSSMLDYNKLVKAKKHNIGIEKNPNMTIIREYYDEQKIN
jgi:hypothetical protein